MGAFFARCGQLLAQGGEPEAVWPGLVGIVRWSPFHGARELTGEWALAMEVLTAACESFDGDPKVAEWLARAVATAEKGTAAIRDPHSGTAEARGLLLLVVYGGLGVQRRGAKGAEG